MSAYDGPKTVAQFPHECGDCGAKNILLPNGFRVCLKCDCLGSNYKYAK